MAGAIRCKKEIRGTLVKGNEIKLSQYADDTTLILNGYEKSLQESLNLGDIFSMYLASDSTAKRPRLCGLELKAGSDFQLLSEKGLSRFQVAQEQS